MDPKHFDALTQSLSSAASSRRRLLTGLAGSAVAALATALGFAEAEATHFTCLHVEKRCKKASQCCSSRCKHGRCRAHHVGQCTAEKDVCVTGEALCGGGSCICIRTTSGANFCGSGVFQCMACSTDAECATALAMPGSACIDLNHGICGCGGTGCVAPCTA